MEQITWGVLIIADFNEEEIATNSNKHEFITKILKFTNNSTNDNLEVVFCIRCKQTYAKILNHNIDYNDFTQPLCIATNSNIYLIDCNITTNTGINFLCTKYLSTERYKYRALFTWGHGKVYSLFNTVSQNDFEKLMHTYLKMVSANSFLKEKMYYRNYEASINPLISGRISENQLRNSNILFDYNTRETSTKYLNINELANGIMNNKYKKKLDLITMNHCYMANYDCAITLSKCTKYWMAALNTVEYDSINYVALFEYIKTNQNTYDLLPENISKKVITSFITQQNYYLFDLSLIRLLKNTVNNFAISLIREMNIHGFNYIDDIIDSFSEGELLINSSTYSIYNLLTLCEKVKNNNNTSEQTKLASYNIDKISRKIIVPKSPIDSTMGLSVFLPKKYLQNTPDIDANAKDIIDQLGKDTWINYNSYKWDLFLYVYFQKAINKKT